MCGRIQARLEDLTLPDTIDQSAQHIDEHRSSAHAAAADQRTVAERIRDLTHFGSVWWKPSRRDNPNNGIGTR